MKRLKQLLPTILLGLIFLVGIGVLAYPTVSDWWNRRVQSRAVAMYDESVASLTERDYSEYLAAAKAYNDEILRIGSSTVLARPDIIEGYEDTLNFDRGGVIGSITIDKIDVNLPIYHGTSQSVLTVGAGHLQGSSLPIGGESTHTVISAHRGLPRAKLFTNLDQMEEGDIFALHVMGDDLYYEVDQIAIVLPNEMEELYIQKGKDLCTLMTCTPYGINTHRMLVRGHRIYPTAEEIAADEAINSERVDTTWIRILLAVVAIAAAIWLLSSLFVKIAGFINKKDS